MSSTAQNLRLRFYVHIFSSVYIATDINTHACRCTVATARKNKASVSSALNSALDLSSDITQSEVDTIRTSLTGPLSTRLRNSVDLLIFNPPYVPTESTESQQGQEHGQISSSWAGGFDGMEVTNKLLGESQVRNGLRRDLYNCDPF